MPLLSVAKRLVTPLMARRGAVLSTLVLFERVLVPAAAWALFRRGLSDPIALAFAAGAAFSARTFVQRAFRARTEVELLERVASHVVRGNVLRANVLRDEDVRAELGQAMYHAAQNISVVLPLLAADALAAPLLAAVVFAREPPRLVEIAVATTLLGGAMLFGGRRSIERAVAAAWTAQQEAFMAFMDAIEGRLEVVASGRSTSYLAAFHVKTAAWGKAAARVAAGALVTGKLPFLSVAAIVAIAIAVVSTSGRASLGITAADIALLASIAPAFSGVAQNVFALLRAERWMGVVARVLDEPRLGIGGGLAPAPGVDSIAFERVTFSYPGAGRPALRDVSFVWNRERVLALTGPNGSGKSTCLRLLLALAKPDSGTITIDDVPLDQIDADAWRQRIAFLPQRPYLPPGSNVRGAVLFLAPDATDDAIREALDRVGLSSAGKRLGRDPLDLPVGALSVGERQRVGIARLLCQTASLVLLDEPDANLDRAGIALIVTLVGDLSRQKRVALVAHHTELLDVADRVLVLGDGGVAEISRIDAGAARR